MTGTSFVRLLFYESLSLRLSNTHKPCNSTAILLLLSPLSVYLLVESRLALPLVAYLFQSVFLPV